MTEYDRIIKKRGLDSAYTRPNYAFTNNKNEDIIVYINILKHDKSNKNDIMNIWNKHKMMMEFIPETIHVDIYVYDEDGNCYDRYNPQIIDGLCKINFDWILESTKENEEKIIKEIIRRANDRFIPVYKTTNYFGIHEPELVKTDDNGYSKEEKKVMDSGIMVRFLNDRKHYESVINEYISEYPENLIRTFIMCDGRYAISIA